MSSKVEKSMAIKVASIVGVLFGVLTLKEGGTTLFISPESGGNFVPFVLWFNFLAGFLYIAAGGGLWMQKHWAAWLSIFIVVATIVVSAMFAVHVLQGGLYEQRTVVAMGLRTTVWVFIALFAYLKILRR